MLFPELVRVLVRVQKPHESVDKIFFYPNSLTNLTNLTSDFETEKKSPFIYYILIAYVIVDI
jgi:hypothetical protein